MLPMQFSTKATQVVLDLTSLFKESTLFLLQSLYRYGTTGMYMYVQLPDNNMKTSCHIP